jgi:hypothetical protein
MKELLVALTHIALMNKFLDKGFCCFTAVPKYLIDVNFALPLRLVEESKLRSSN